MKRFRTLILTIFSLFVFNLIFSQQYQTGRYYASQGQTKTEYRTVQEFNPYYNQYYYVRYCRTLTWKTSYYNGYVYYYDYHLNKWYSRYEAGYFWYCYWTTWYNC